METEQENITKILLPQTQVKGRKNKVAVPLCHSVRHTLKRISELPHSMHQEEHGSSTSTKQRVSLCSNDHVHLRILLSQPGFSKHLNTI